MTLKRKTAAFTLIELVVALGVFLIMLAVVFTGLRPEDNRAGPRAVALFLQAELLAARQQSMTTKQPVALVIPRRGSSYAAGFYLRGGRTSSDILSVRNLQREFPGVAIFVGDVGAPEEIPGEPTSEGKYSSGIGWSIPDESRIPLSWDQSFDLDSWLSAVPPEQQNDAHFVFLPNGTLTTNNEHFHIIVAAGVSASSDTLLSSGEAYTISLSRLGGVELRKGLEVPGLEGGSLPAYSPASLDGLAPPSNRQLNPSITPNAFPKPNTDDPEGEVSPGADYGVAVGQFLSMELVVKDDSGLPLLASFTQEVESAPTPHYGFFGTQMPGNSSPITDPQNVQTYDALIWDQGREVWKAFWTWTPHGSSQPGDVYKIQARIGASSDDFTVGVLADFPNVSVDSPNRFVYDSNQNPTGGLLLHVMNESGSQESVLVNLDTPADVQHPTVSWDGQKIAFRMRNPARTDDDIWLTDPSGREIIPLTANDLRNETAPKLSPLGDKIAWKIALEAPHEGQFALVWAPIGESPLDPRLVTIQTDVIFFDSFSWNRDGTRLALEIVRDGGRFEIWEYDTTVAGGELRGYFGNPDGDGASLDDHLNQNWVTHPAMELFTNGIPATTGNRGAYDYDNGTFDLSADEWRTDFEYHNPRLLLYGDESIRCPSYNRAGDKLYFVYGNGNEFGGLTKIYAVPLSGNDKKPLSPVFFEDQDPIVYSTQGVTNPAESPDGTKLLYWQGEQIMLKSLTSGETRALTTGNATSRRPDWITPPLPLP